MIGKLSPLILALLVISPQTQPCAAVDIIGVVSAAKGLYPFIKELAGKLFEQPETADELLLAVQHMNDDVQYQLGEISKSLKDLPAIFDHVTKRNKLQDHVNNIGFVFKSAVKLKKNIEANKREDESTYQLFRTNHEAKIDKDVYEINRMMVNDEMTSYLAKNFSEGLRLYENVCETRMSHLQLLDSLLAKLKVVTAQYFLTKNMIYDFVLPYKTDSHAFDTTRDNLRVEVHNNYNYAVRKFKAIMATASQELWRCDAPKTPRYENKRGAPYFELMAFSKYIFNEGVYATRALTCPYTKCPAITKVDSCGRNDVSYLCRNTRRCPNKLVGCSNLHSNHHQLSYICLNSDKNAVNRYTSLVPEDKVGELSCPNGRQEFMRDLQFGGMGSQMPITFCNFCQCICAENEYYISTIPVYADTIDHKVVTGARLVIEDNTLYIQIQQGGLLPNGQVNASTVEWKEIEKHSQQRVPINWDGVRSIDLTRSKLPKDYLVAGFAFMKSEFTPNRISLVTYSCHFLFDIGKNLCPYPEQYYGIFYEASPKDELKLENVDVPTKSIKPNAPDSNNAQYVTFTTTDMQKDGGQTTVPFIDTQEVVTNPPMPLGGAGLYHRGQEGYGGFLGLKLYTYNIVDYISEEPEF